MNGASATKGDSHEQKNTARYKTHAWALPYLMEQRALTNETGWAPPVRPTLLLHLFIFNRRKRIYFTITSKRKKLTSTTTTTAAPSDGIVRVIWLQQQAISYGKSASVYYWVSEWIWWEKWHIHGEWNVQRLADTQCIHNRALGIWSIAVYKSIGWGHQQCSSKKMDVNTPKKSRPSISGNRVTIFSSTLKRSNL